MIGPREVCQKKGEHMDDECSPNFGSSKCEQGSLNNLNKHCQPFFDQFVVKKSPPETFEKD